jgi:hypothetical protein
MADVNLFGAILFLGDSEGSEGVYIRPPMIHSPSPTVAEATLGIENEETFSLSAFVGENEESFSLSVFAGGIFPLEIDTLFPPGLEEVVGRVSEHGEPIFNKHDD